MLRKRSRPFQSRSQLQTSDLASDSSFSCDINVPHKAKPSSSFFTIPGLFVGFTTKSPESDSSISPTSPLDSKGLNSPKSPRSWNCNRVGLGLIDTFSDEVLSNYDNRCIVLGSPKKVNILSPKSHLSSPKSLPKNYGFSKLEIASSMGNESSLSRNICKSNSEVFPSELKRKLSGSLPIPIGDNGNGFMDSEDYTCIISHGPNPKTTHIFGDCVLDIEQIQSLECKNNVKIGDDFLRYCFSCKKRLEQGEDIYMYRGEKAFCSCKCRDQEILSEEEMENIADTDTDNISSSSNEEIFISGMAMAS